MTIHLKPELEALIKEDVERGPYQSADEYVAQAVQMLHAHERSLAEDRADIEQGFVQAERGELFDPDEVRAHLNERKKVWMNQK